MESTMRNQTELQTLRVEIGTASTLLGASMKTLAVVDAPSYAKADMLLSKVCNLRSSIKDRLKRITDPLNAALREIRGFGAELDNPLETWEHKIRTSMSDFKIEERRQLQAAEAERQRQAQEAQRAAIEAAAKETAAKTQAMRERLAAKREALMEQAAVIMAQPKPEPLKAAGSTTRVTWKARVIDATALRAAVVAGQVPDDVCPIDEAALNRLAKIDHKIVGKFPGVEVYEDLTIARKG